MNTETQTQTGFAAHREKVLDLAGDVFPILFGAMLLIGAFAWLWGSRPKKPGEAEGEREMRAEWKILGVRAFLLVPLLGAVAAMAYVGAQ